MTRDSLKLYDPYAIGEALAAMMIKFADCIRDNQAPDPASTAIIRNIAATVQETLAGGRNALLRGETEAALFALACADGAVSLIVGLLAAPNDPLLQKFAEPFTSQVKS